MKRGGVLPRWTLSSTLARPAVRAARVDALVQLLNRRVKAITTDEMRRNIEELGPTAYDGLGYYERWMHGVTQTLLQRGLINIDELGRKMAEIEARERHG